MVKYIDLENIIKDLDSPVLKRMPRFVVKILTGIIRQKEMNRILNKYSQSIGVSFLPEILKEFNLKIVVENPNNLPESGRCIFVANHPFGIIDGLILTHIVAQKYGTLKAIGNDAFMLVPNLRPLIAAVNVYGQNPKNTIAALDELYRSETPVTHFPAGSVSRMYHWKIQDCEWQKSFITKAIATNRPVVPFYFYGRNSMGFYMLEFVRKCFGIKANLELMLLPGEMLRKKGKTIRVKIGKPILPSQFGKSNTSAYWAQKVREYVYRMGTSEKEINFNE